jgi:hypothetical protein
MNPEAQRKKEGITVWTQATNLGLELFDVTRHVTVQP